MCLKLYLALSAVLSVTVTVLGITSIAPVLSAVKAVGLFIVFFVGFLVLHIVVLAVASLFSDMSKPCMKRHPFYRHFLGYSAEALLSLCRVKVHISGEKLPDERFLLVSNHRSCFDPIVCMDVFKKHEIAFISKPENFRIPIVGRFVHNCGYLAIDRENARNAMHTINTAAQMLDGDLCSVGIYPEGTRSKTGVLLPFHNGVFRIAQKAKAPIAVITVKGTEKVAKNAPFRRTDVYLDVLKVLDFEDYSEMKYNQLGDMVHEMMEHSVEKSV